MKFTARAVSGLFIIALVPEVLSPLNARKLTLEECVLVIGRIANDGDHAQDKQRLNECNIAINPSEWTRKERMKILTVISEHPEIFGELRK